MKAVLNELLQSVDFASLKSSSPVVTNRKIQKDFNLFRDALKKAIKIGKGKGEIVLKGSFSFPEKEKGEGISFGESGISLIRREKELSCLADKKKGKDKIEKEKLEKILSCPSSLGILDLDTGKTIKEIEPLDIVFKKGEAVFKATEKIEESQSSPFHLMRFQDREVLACIEDFRTGVFSSKAIISPLSQVKKLTSFEKELKTTSPSLIEEAMNSNPLSEPTGFFISESDLSSSSALMHDSLKREGVGSDFRSWDELASKIGTQIIDKARIILKDGGRGEIQLRLYPEKLGSVRIQLDMEGIRVFARFIVDSAQVKQVFESSSRAFEQSLSQSGFDISLDFSTSGEGDGQKNSFFQHTDDGSSMIYPEITEVHSVVISNDVESIIDMVI